ASELLIVALLLSLRPVEVLGPSCINDGDDGPKEESEDDQHRPLGPGLLRWRNRVIYYGDDWGIVDFLNTRRLVLPAQIKVQVLSDVDLPVETPLFENELRSLLPRAVTLVEATEVIFRLVKIAFTVGESLFNEFPTLPSS